MEIDLTGVWLNALAKIPVCEDIAEDNDDHQVITRYTPLGVCVAIVPWKFPILLACDKTAPALVTGNTLIVKPSPFTAYYGLKLGELAQAYFPLGVCQVIGGSDSYPPGHTGQLFGPVGNPD